MGKFLKSKKTKPDSPDKSKSTATAVKSAETTTKTKTTAKAPEKPTKKTKKKKSGIDRRTLPRVVSTSKIFPRIEVAHKECGSAQVSRETLDKIKALADKEGCRAFDVTEKFLRDGLASVSKKPKKD